MTDKKFPTPEEVHREFEEFVRKRFGDSVKIFAQQVGQGNQPDLSDSVPEKKPIDLNFHLKPKDIKTYLDRFVIKQDDAKKALSIAVCDHYNHVRQCHENPDMVGENYSKQNVLVLGPTGVGKTYLIRQIAKLIGVPFVKADATRFSETGYVGGNVDDLIHDLVSQADGNLELAQYGIIYLDEADKLASSSSNNKQGRDVSGRGVQFGLLKLMEETEVDLRAGNDMKSQMQAFMEFQQKGKVDKYMINTRHILFIISGAFTGLTDLIKERMNQNKIGFNNELKEIEHDEDFLAFAKTQDFVEYGFEPEFIGRLPIRVSCSQLKVEDLFKILKNSEGSIIRQYETAFRAHGIAVHFEDEALKAIATQAAIEKTGARGLMTICENILRDFKFELPSLNISEFAVTKALIDDPGSALKEILANPQYKPAHPYRERMLRQADRFYRDHEMRLRLDEGAVDLLCTMADEKSKRPEEVFSELFKSYEHGLKLVQQNTGQTEFFITKEVVEDPQKSLELWIADSYTKSIIPRTKRGHSMKRDSSPEIQ